MVEQVEIPASAGVGAPAFDVAGALKAGYTQAEIAQHLAQTNKFDYAAATKAGYTPGEIIDHLVPKGDELSGALEAGLHTITGGVGKVAGDVAGLATIPANFVGLTDKGPEDVQNAVRNGLTYSPRTQIGNQDVDAVNTALSNTVGLPGRGLAAGAKALGAGEYGQNIAQEVGNQATGLLGVKYAPVIAKASAPYVGAGMRGAADAADWTTNKMENIAKNKYVTGTAGVDAAMTGLINPASIPTMAAAGAAGAGLYGGLKLAAPLLRAGANKVGAYAEGAAASDPILRGSGANGTVPTTSEIFDNARDNVRSVLGKGPGPVSPDSSPTITDSTGNPVTLDRLLQAQALRQQVAQAPAATQAASTSANNAAAGASQAAAQTAATGVGQKTPTEAVLKAVSNKVIPLTQAQANAAWSLQKMGMKTQYALDLVRKVDPSITDPNAIFRAAVAMKGK